ncbi:MAG TPA: glycosyltransferase family 25 protein [Flavisolibacter sp.]|jgi:glycosyl transferase family 25|nr:glycosyltransferase family 25 protein [Flavisolibacter sp.]
MIDFFRTINLFFDKVYVLTLERETQRHEHIRKELYGLEYELLYGVDKQSFRIDDLKAKGLYDEEQARRHHRFGKPMSAGMIGCSWSHRNAYDHMIRNKVQKALILEDDVIIDKGHTALLPAILAELPRNWELVYFGYFRHEQAGQFSFLKQAAYHIQRLIGRHKFSHQTISNLYAKPYSAHLLKAGYHDQTHAYGLTLAGAKKLRKLQDPITFFPDNLLAYAITNGLLNAYATRPKLINQLSQNDNVVFHTSIGD